MLSLLCIIVAVFLVWSCAAVGSGVWVRAYCRGARDRGSIALTFDDGAGAETGRVLDVLKRRGVEAAFFLIGERAQAAPETVRRIVGEGHVAGIHSYSHRPSFPLLGRRKMIAEIVLTAEAIETATGLRPRLFRPPFGVTNPTVARAVGHCGVDTIGWSVRSLDTLGRPQERTLRRIARRLESGSIVLLHDDRAGCAALVESVLDEAARRGLKIERVDKMLNIKAYED